MDSNIILTIASLATALGVWFTYSQSNTNKKLLHLTTLERCISEFRGYTGLNDENCSDTTILNYVDLVNEEMFYFKHNYLPQEVAYEWIDGMIDYIPLTDNKENILNQNNCIEKLKKRRKEFFKNFPRLKETFIIRNLYDFDIVYSEDFSKQELRALTRKKIAEEIYNNTKRFEF